MDNKENKFCPFCGEEIKLSAKKCRHCGKWVDNNITTGNKTISDNMKQGNKVILKQVPDSCDKISLLRIVREIKNCDLNTAKKIIETSPSLICQNLSAEEAITIKKRFERTGVIIAIEGIDYIEEQTKPIVNNDGNDNISKIKQCPFCGEDILYTAKKCKHCGEFIDKTEKSNNTFKIGPFQSTVCTTGFILLGYSFIDNNFGEFFWNNFFIICLITFFISGIAYSIDQSIGNKK